MWVAEPPVPRSANDCFQIGHGGFPAQYSFRFRGIGDQSGRITGTRWFDAHGNVASGNLARAFDDLQNGIAASGSQVQKIGTASGAKMIQGQDMRGNAIVIDAMVPLAKMFGYVNTLRSMTQGRAQYTMQFDHYEQVPTNMVDEIKKKVA